MARKDNQFDTAYFTNGHMERCFHRIFIKKRPFCSPETSKPEVCKLPSFVLIEGGIMILHEEAFQEDLKDAWEAYARHEASDKGH